MMSHLFRAGTLLAINLLFAMIWGFAGVGKLKSGVPSWFGDKFGSTFLAGFPGLTATFWILTVSEVAAFALAAAALLAGEGFRRRAPMLLTGMLVWSLFVFIQLGFGQWLTGEFNGAFQQFVYFAGTMICLLYVQMASQAGSSERQTELAK